MQWGPCVGVGCVPLVQMFRVVKFHKFTPTFIVISPDRNAINFLIGVIRKLELVVTAREGL